MNVYPNPTENTITMDFLVATYLGGVVRIVGQNGIIIFEQQIEDKGMHQLTFDMTSVSAGLYFVNYADALGVTVKHIVKR